MRRLIVWACLTGLVLADAGTADAQEPWRPEWRSRRAQAELPVPGPEPETAYVVPGPETWEEGAPDDVGQRMTALQAELNMLRHQLRGQMAAPPGTMPMPGHYGPGEMVYEGDMMHGPSMPLHDGPMVGPMVGHGCGPDGCAVSCAVLPSCPCCDTCGPLSFGADGVFLHPSFVGNQAFLLQSQAINGGAPLTQNAIPFDWDTEASYRVWVALKDCDRFGIRGSFWRFENSIGDSALVEPGQTAVATAWATPGSLFDIQALPGTTIGASHRLDLTVVDLDIVKDILFPKAMLTLTVGLRYARNEQNYEVDVLDAGGLTLASLEHFHRFEGMGPTVGFELRRCIGCCGLSVYVHSKGSAVFGQTDSRIEELETAILRTYAGNDFDEPLLIGEVGFGFQYSWHKLWLRAGYEAQYWMNAGNANQTGTDLGLVGFTASAGLGF